MRRVSGMHGLHCVSWIYAKCSRVPVAIYLERRLCRREFGWKSSVDDDRRSLGRLPGLVTRSGRVTDATDSECTRVSHGCDCLLRWILVLEE